jgi:two-component system, OmpR family, alkaline phosphatase synthesis response regulator PhoP
MLETHILVVEDEESLANTLALNLQMEKFKVQVAHTGPEALRKFNNHSPAFNLVLLDVMLPGIGGHDLFAEFRKKDPSVPIIFLTAKGQPSDKISGLKLGADDYIVKPFDLEELMLRINNVIKRNTKGTPQVFTFNNCSVNFETFDVKDIQGHTLTLSKREIGLLKLLTSNVNKVISRDEIIDTLWEPNENASSRTIDNYILSFRKYFEENPKDPRHFHSVRGVGYKFTL